MMTGRMQHPISAQGAIRVPVLCYHNIDHSGSAYSTTPETLGAQCQWLTANGFTTISVYQLWNAFASGEQLPSNPVMLTNDDGWSSAVTFAQVLGAHGMTGN